VKKIVFIAALLWCLSAYSRHIIGGNITYDCLGSNNYRITMKLYKDCLDPASPDFDRPAYFLIFNLDNNSLFSTETMDPSNERNIIPVSAGCIDNLPDFCTKEATYTFDINLPVNTKGYMVAYERCCRNSGVINVANSGDYGTAMFIVLTKQAMTACNKAPVFKNDPPNFVCIGSSLNIDFSATDANGDRLVYSLCPPYTAGDAGNPLPPSSGPIDYPPFGNITYNSGYNALQPLGNLSPISIDSLTGKISGIPRTQGLFTIAVCVKEYRAGVLMSQSVRDFQVNVQDCAIKEAHPMPPNDPKKASVKINDSTYVVCNGRSVQFTNPGSTNITYFWDFGNPNTLADTSKIGSPVYTYPDTGTYRVKLVIERGKPCTDSGIVYVKVYDPLSIRPRFTPACIGNAVQFMDSSVSTYNDINSWKWKFNAADSALTKNATHTYPSAGNYTLSFFVGTSKGCLVQKDTTVSVYPRPVANFNSNNLCFRRNTAFTDASTITSGAITRYFWNYGDGFTDTLKNVSHAYNVFDSFRVQHIVTSSFGCKDTIVKNVRMDDTVRLSYTTSPAVMCVGVPITFTNTSAGGNPTAFQWIINNGSAVNNLTATSVTFSSAGTFPVKLISTNRCGNDTLNSTITISAGPAVNIGPDVTVCNKSAKQLTASGVFDSVRWSTGETTSSIFIDGKKTPIMVSVYKSGCVGRDTLLAKQQVVTPNFTNNYLCYQKPVTFNNTSTVNNGTLTSYDWDYGDATQDLNVKNPTHTFMTFGNFPVRLIATSDIGCKDTLIKTIPMDTVLSVDFKTAELVSCERKQVQFVDLTTGGFSNQNIWHINGTTLSGKNVNYTFSGPGNYPVKLMVNNRCYSDSATKNISVRPRPNVNLGRDTILCKNQRITLSVNPAAYDSIRWINGSNGSSVSVDGTINPYKIKVYLDGCDAEDTVKITPQKFTLNFTNTFICYNNEITFNNTSTVTPGTITNYFWNFGDGATANIKDPLHTYQVFGPKNIQLIARSNSNCSDTLAKQINMDDSVSLSITPVPTDICIKSTGMFANLSTGGVNTAYTWTLNSAQPKSDSVSSYTFTTLGSQVLMLLATNRCGRDSIQYHFNSKPLPEVTLPDTIIMCPGDTRILEAKGSFDSLFWNNGTNINPTTIDGTQPFVVFTGYRFGCSSSDSTHVVANCDVYISTAFSPNHDGINDFFNIIPANIVSYDLKIYDRWGEMVFETTDVSKSWDGTYKGKDCQQDNYVYYATGVKKDQQPFSLKGTVTLVR
jgi:gliding motility-associated-like protein